MLELLCLPEIKSQIGLMHCGHKHRCFKLCWKCPYTFILWHNDGALRMFMMVHRFAMWTERVVGSISRANCFCFVPASSTSRIGHNHDLYSPDRSQSRSVTPHIYLTLNCNIGSLTIWIITCTCICSFSLPQVQCYASNATWSCIVYLTCIIYFVGLKCVVVHYINIQCTV